MLDEARSLGSNLASVIWVALRSLLGTALVAFLGGIALAGVSYYFLRDNPWYGLAAAAIALAESVWAGIFLGSKRALVIALAHGLQSLRLGKSLVRLLFERMLGVTAQQGSSERAGWVAQRIENVPLAQVEKRLSQAASDLVKAQPTGGGVTGWLRRWLQRKLLKSVQTYTLAGLREEGTQQGGVNLARLQANLESRIDDELLARTKARLNLMTALLIVAIPLVVFAQTYAVALFLQAK